MKKVILFFLFFFSNCFNLGYEPKKDHFTYIKPEKIFYAEIEKKLSIDNFFTEIANINFLTRDFDYINLGTKTKNVLVHFELRNIHVPILLEILEPIQKEITLFQIVDGKIINTYIIRQDMQTKGFFRNHPFFQLPILPFEGSTQIYLEVESIEVMNLPILIWDIEYLNYVDGYRMILFGIFFGFLISLAIYNFLLFISIQDRTYLYYTGYILSFGAFLFTAFGFLGYFWRNQLREYVYYFIPFTAILASNFAVAFSRKFLNLYTIAPRLAKFINYYIIIGIIFQLLIIPFYNHGTSITSNLHAFIGVFILLTGAYLAIREGFTPAYYFVIAWIGLLIGVSLFILGNLGLIQSNFTTFYLQFPGAAFEAVMLSLALGFRINDLRKKEEKSRESALQKEILARKKQEEMTNSFKRFVPEEFLINLNRSSILEIERGDSKLQTMSVLFSDIRRFTDFSEKHSPETVMKFLNQYLEIMEPIIKSNHGFIDKFIGDAIMALFLKEEDAVNAGLEMLNSIALYKYPDNSNIDIGIGVHSGELILGTIGSNSRIETTVIGDTVNLASRIESLNSTYSTKFLISENVINKIHNKNFFYREVDLVRVKGKKLPVRLFEAIH